MEKLKANIFCQPHGVNPLPSRCFIPYDDYNPDNLVWKYFQLFWPRPHFQRFSWSGPSIIAASLTKRS